MPMVAGTHQNLPFYCWEFEIKPADFGLKKEPGQEIIRTTIKGDGKKQGG
jgi:hypothetical protein